MPVFTPEAINDVTSSDLVRDDAIGESQKHAYSIGAYASNGCAIIYFLKRNRFSVIYS